MKIEEKDGKLNIIDFNEIEAYKIARKIEEDGIRFYENILKGIKNNQVKEKIKFLLGEEKNHLRFFQECLSGLNQKIEDGFEEDDLLNYLDYGIFKPYQDMKEIKYLVSDVEKALSLGIVIEDKSIKFYQACRNNVSSAVTKEELDSIVEEEKRHRISFQEMLILFQKSQD